MEIIIQCIIGKIYSNKIEYICTNVTSDNKNPDDQVIECIKKLGLTNLKKYIVHSTSWHWEINKIILTYLIVIPRETPITMGDFLDIKTQPLAYGENTYTPRPKELKTENIIRHAFRHLAYLLKHDYTDAYKDIFSADQKKYILSVYDEVAEEITTLN